LIRKLIVAVIVASAVLVTSGSAHARRRALATPQDCALACADECLFVRPGKCRKLKRQCVRGGVGVCGGLPVTAFGGSWGYSAAYVGSSGCVTDYPATVAGTFAIDVARDGTVTGWGDGFIALSGNFTSSSLHVSSDYWELDASGCYEAVDATVTNLGLTGGHLDLILSQDCGGVVCMDHYAGRIAR
jgi:hypothetical protein